MLIGVKVGDAGRAGMHIQERGKRNRGRGGGGGGGGGVEQEEEQSGRLSISPLIDVSNPGLRPGPASPALGATRQRAPSGCSSAAMGPRPTAWLHGAQREDRRSLRNPQQKVCTLLPMEFKCHTHMNTRMRIPARSMHMHAGRHKHAMLCLRHRHADAV